MNYYETLDFSIKNLNSYHPHDIAKLLHFYKVDNIKALAHKLLSPHFQVGLLPPSLIIHISGPSGSGKTVLGHKLKDKFGNKIVVKDIDDLRDEFIKEYYGSKEWTIIDKDAYQKYIDGYINKQEKPIVFVGLNNLPWFHKNHYYDMHATQKYYIEIDDMTIVKQKCLRLFRDISDDEMAMDDLVNNNETFVKMVKNGIDRECGAKETIKMNEKWNEDYRKQGYKFMTRDEIYDAASRILYNCC